MEIGQKLRSARQAVGMTQEKVAQTIHVSRQTISNWETGKTFPDIASIIELSNLYSLSLDALLKGDPVLIQHLEESTDMVRSNKKLIGAVLLNIAIVALLFILSVFFPDNQYFLIGVFLVMAISAAVLLYQIIQRF